MKKDHIEIPVPSSKFLKISCKECSEVQVVYSHVASKVTCKACGNIIAESTGGTAKIYGEVTGSAE